MLERLLSFSLKFRFLGLDFYRSYHRRRHFFRAPACHRCGARHYQRSGAGYYPHRAYGTGGGRTVRNLSGRDRHERHARRRRNPLAIPLRPVRGYGGIQGQYRSLFCPPTDRREIVACQGKYTYRVWQSRNGTYNHGLGEVYQFVVRGKDLSPMELRTLLDWQIGYRLRSVPGVVEVNAMGGYAKQYEVVVDPKKLISYRIPIGRVFEALEKNNLVTGGGYIEHGGEAYIIRGEGMMQNSDEIARIIVEDRNGTPITVDQIGEIEVGSVPRIGAATMNGEGEAVVAVTLMLSARTGKLWLSGSRRR